MMKRGVVGMGQTSESDSGIRSDSLLFVVLQVIDRCMVYYIILLNSSNRTSVVPSAAVRMQCTHTRGASAKCHLGLNPDSAVQV